MKKNNINYFVLVTSILTIGVTAIPCFAQETRLRIISPASNLVVRPGQTVTIAVSADPSVQKLVLIGQDPIGMARLASGGAAGMMAQGQGEGHPMQFLLTIPTPIRPGTYHVTAVGRTSGGMVESDALAFDVERPDAPIRI